MSLKGFFYEHEAALENYSRRTEGSLELTLFNKDLAAANEALLLAMESHAVVAHMHLKLFREPQRRAAWVLNRQRSKASDYTFFKLVDTAYRFTCEMRLLNFLMPTTRNELPKLLPMYFFPVSFDPVKHYKEAAAMFDKGALLAHKRSNLYFRDTY